MTTLRHPFSRATRSLLIVVLAAAFSALRIFGQNTTFNFDFDFKGASVSPTWEMTKDATVAPSENGITLSATGWDAKIYRTIIFPPGRYVLTARGMGSLRLLVFDGWKSSPLANLNMDGSAIWTDYCDFEVPAGPVKSLIICAQVMSKGKTGTIESIRVDSAPGVVSAPISLPSPDELARNRPSPPIVRGFVVGTVFEDTTKLKDNLRAAATWGANVVRLQLDAPEAAHAQKLDFWAAWPAYVDRVVDVVNAAGADGLKVVVDMHVAPLADYNMRKLRDKPALWHSPALESSFTRAWTDLATRLKGNPAVWAYDLYNEPLDRTQLPWAPKEWYPLAVKITQAIRKVDPEVWLIYECGPGGMPRGFENLQPLPDTRVIYSCHDYAPGDFTFQGVDYKGDLYQHDFTAIGGVHYPGMIKGVRWNRAQMVWLFTPVIEFQKKWHVPIYIGEFSVIRWAPKDDAVKWLQDSISMFEENGWSWSYHAFREWHGWSLEHDETFWKKGMPQPKPVTGTTARGGVIRQALEKNHATP